jgi:pimeloyl-ACP methyl ester carboxylesterase
MQRRPRPTTIRTRRNRLLISATLGVAAVVVATTAGAAAAHAKPAAPSPPKPTIVLVHGAWADSSSWDGVVKRLQRDHYTVDVFPTPLRSLTTDAAYLRSYLAAITGPIVLVGHSYGGAVVTDAATGNSNVKKLVYLDAFAPAKGESVLQLAGPTSALANPDPTKVFTFVPKTLPPTLTTDLYVLPSVFPAAFANDLSPSEGAVLAATQRPVTYGALTEHATVPAWKTIPSWYEVGTIDKVIPAAQQLFMAHRANAHIVTVRTSHLPMVSAPRAVAGTIEAAAAGS